MQYAMLIYVKPGDAGPTVVLIQYLLNFHGCRTPLSGIWGEFDSTTYPYIQERIDIFRAVQPDFVMSVIPGAGHWVAYEASDAFNAKLLEVLRP